MIAMVVDRGFRFGRKYEVEYHQRYSVFRQSRILYELIGGLVGDPNFAAGLGLEHTFGHIVGKP